MGLQIITIPSLCAQLRGSQAKSICEAVNKDGMRVRAGDQSLHAEINENGKRVDRAASEGDVVAAQLKRIRGSSIEENPSPSLTEAKNWNSTRALELYSNKLVIQSCRDNRVRSPAIQNYCNHAVMGNLVSTSEFKKQHGIPPHVSLQDVMSLNQLNMRKLVEDVLAKDFETRYFKCSRMAEKHAYEVCKEYHKLFEKSGVTGLQVLPQSGKPFAAFYRAIEAEIRNTTQRKVKQEHDLQAQGTWKNSAVRALECDLTKQFEAEKELLIRQAEAERKEQAKKLRQVEAEKAKLLSQAEAEKAKLLSQAEAEKAELLRQIEELKKN